MSETKQAPEEDETSLLSEEEELAVRYLRGPLAEGVERHHLEKLVVKLAAERLAQSEPRAAQAIIALALKVHKGALMFASNLGLETWILYRQVKHKYALPLWQLLALRFPEAREGMMNAARNDPKLKAALRAVEGSQEGASGTQAQRMAREMVDEECFFETFTKEIKVQCEERKVSMEDVQGVLVGAVEQMLKKEMFVERAIANLAGFWDWKKMCALILEKGEEILKIDSIHETPARWLFVEQSFVNNPIISREIPSPEQEPEEEPEAKAKPLVVEKLAEHCKQEVTKKREWLKERFQALSKDEPESWEELRELKFVHPEYSEEESWRQDVILHGVEPGITEETLKDTMIFTDVSRYHAIRQFDHQEYVSRVVRRGHLMFSQFQQVMNQKIRDAGVSLEAVKVGYGPVKTAERMRTKAETDYQKAGFPTSARVIDIIRGSVTFTKLSSMLEMIHAWLKMFGEGTDDPSFRIVRVKNGFAKLKDGEMPKRYMDVKINAIITTKHPSTDEPISLLSEVQLILKPMLQFKKREHELYQVVRLVDLHKQVREEKKSMSLVQLAKNTGYSPKKLAPLIFKFRNHFTKEYFEKELQECKENMPMQLMHANHFTPEMARFFEQLMEEQDMAPVWRMSTAADGFNLLAVAIDGGCLAGIRWIWEHLPRPLVLDMAHGTGGFTKAALGLLRREVMIDEDILVELLPPTAELLPGHPGNLCHVAGDRCDARLARFLKKHWAPFEKALTVPGTEGWLPLESLMRSFYLKAEEKDDDFPLLLCPKEQMEMNTDGGNAAHVVGRLREFRSEALRRCAEGVPYWDRLLWMLDRDRMWCPLALALSARRTVDGWDWRLMVPQKALERGDGKEADESFWDATTGEGAEWNLARICAQNDNMARWLVATVPKAPLQRMLSVGGLKSPLLEACKSGVSPEALAMLMPEPIPPDFFAFEDRTANLFHVTHKAEVQRWLLETLPPEVCDQMLMQPNKRRRTPMQEVMWELGRPEKRGNDRPDFAALVPRDEKVQHEFWAYFASKVNARMFSSAIDELSGEETKWLQRVMPAEEWNKMRDSGRLFTYIGPRLGKEDSKLMEMLLPMDEKVLLSYAKSALVHVVKEQNLVAYRWMEERLSCFKELFEKDFQGCELAVLRGSIGFELRKQDEN